jgi:glyoxylase-like metal-dependent hydrolase (beta-lactamase superfamily II)
MDWTRIDLGGELFEGPTNSYLIQGDSTVLIDTGVASEDSIAALEVGLAENHTSVNEIDAILLTHWHPDHAGYAGVLQRRAGASVYAHPRDARRVTATEGPLAAGRSDRRQALRKWGVPAEVRMGLESFFEDFSFTFGPPPEIESVTHGTVLSLGTLDFEVVHLPGHTAGHVGYFFEENGTNAFVGDTLLGEYTPNIGGADVRVEKPLDNYLQSLETIAHSGVQQALVGHREILEDPIQRIESIQTHHRNRSERVVSMIENDGPLDCWSVAKRLFGDLRGIHALHGTGEAFAHLQHLETGGILRSDITAERTYRYHHESKSPTVDSIFEQRNTETM